VLLFALLPATSAFVTPHRTYRSPSRTVGQLSCPQVVTLSQQPSTLQASTIEFFKQDGKKRLAGGMAFLTGWADAALVTRYKTFSTMMTGNTMWMAQALVQNRYRDALYYMTVLLSYMVGVGIYRKIDQRKPGKAMPVSAGIVLSLFLGSELVHHLQGRTRWIPATALAMGFGLLNSAGQAVTGGLTFVVTGHMTQATNQFVDRFLSHTKKDLNVLGLLQNGSVYLGFFAGAAMAWWMRRFPHVVSYEFAYMGILYGGIMLWQDGKARGLWKRKTEQLKSESSSSVNGDDSNAVKSNSNDSLSERKHAGEL